VALEPVINSLVNNGPVSASTGSPDSIGLARKWLANCLSSHSCADSNLNPCWNPTRLLDIGLGAIPEPRLFLTAKVKERLSYLALSHCWGGVVQETLKKGNLANMRSFIPLSKLTKSVQDAIYVVQKLGYRYLWVDYLCIIQDCPMDWGQESAIMNKVYLHSTCTIAATAATDGHAGLFFQRNPCLVKPEKIRFLIGREEFECFAIDDGLLEGEIDSAPLSKRAWVMQETTLSTRIIHFAKDQLFWTCNANQSCESFPERLPWFSNNIPGKYASIEFRVHYMLASQLAFAMAKNDEIESMMYRDRPYILDLPKDIILDESIEGINCGTSATQKAKGIAQRRYHNNIYQEIWARMVEDYSSRHLTRPEDKGPAIQGLANEMKRHIKSPYIAGLWYINLPLDLLWQRAPWNTCTRTPSYRAPSWSWLSIDGPVTLPRFDCGIPAPKVEILQSSTSMQCTNWGVDHQCNALHIQGRLARGIIDRSGGTGPDLIYKVLGYKPIETYGPYEDLGLEINCDFPPLVGEGFIEIYIVQLVGYGRFYDTNTSCARGLVLEKVKGKLEFTRYGYLNFGCDVPELTRLVKAFDKFDRSEASEILFFERRGNLNIYNIILV